MEVLPDRVVDAVLDEVHRTRQRAVLGPWRRRPMSRTTLAAAVVVAVVMVGSAFFVIQRGQPAVIGPAPTASASASPSQPAVAAPTATLPPRPEVSPSPAASSAKLTWTKVDLDRRSPRVAWLGDRFVLADMDSGAVRTSTDGIGWDALQPGDAARAMSICSEGPSRAGRTAPSGGGTRRTGRGRTSPARPRSPLGTPW